MNQVVAIPANWFQILDSVAPAMRPVFTMVNLQAPVVVAAAAASARSSQNFKTMDPVHLAHQNAKGELLGAMSRLGHQFIAAEGGIGNLAGAAPIAQPAHFITGQALRFFWAHVFLACGDECGNRDRTGFTLQTGSAEY
jgi:hypothetical protein